MFYRLKTHSYVLANVKFDTATVYFRKKKKKKWNSIAWYLPVEDTKELYWQIKENIIMKLFLVNAIFC